MSAAVNVTQLSAADKPAPALAAMPPGVPVLLTEEQAAQVLGLKPNTLNEWRYKRVQIPYIKFGRAVRYDLKDIHAYIARNKQEVRDEA